MIPNNVGLLVELMCVLFVLELEPHDDCPFLNITRGKSVMIIYVPMLRIEKKIRE